MKKLFTLLFALTAIMASADEGMWTLHDMDQRTVAVMQKLGLNMKAEDLYKPGQQGSLKDAVVLFGGYCSGVVVSDQGLVFTNHHCGYSSIQQLSSPGEDLLRDGFVAQKAEDERRVPGLFVAFLDSVMDVTDEVQALVCDTMDAESACDSIRRHHRDKGNYTTVDSYYGGTKFFLSVYNRYDDVRLVFTIPESLGKFGGDTDNWMWPRQTCDFSVFRVYADKDGKPAAYSAENKPLSTPRHAGINMNGQGEGGYCMTLGFPGSTERYLSSYGITSMMNTENAARANVRGVLLDVWHRHMAADRAVGIKYSSKAASVSNYWKNSIGMNKALKTLKVEKEKRRLEARINKWINEAPERISRFGGVTDRLKKAYKTAFNDLQAAYVMGETMRGIDGFNVVRAARNIAEATDSLEHEEAVKYFRNVYKDYDKETDRDATIALLANLRKSVNKKYLPAELAAIKDCKAFVNQLYNSTRLLDEGCLGLDSATIASDPLINFRGMMVRAATMHTLDLMSAMDCIEHDEKLLTQAFLEMNMDAPHYSDANMTMRVSFGTIEPYTNTKGIHYDCFTYPASLLEKANNGNPDYNIQPELVELLRSGDFGRYANKDGDLPLCFLTTNDITGGNSGSPMFDGNGNLLGLAFDGNWDALSSDVKFNTAMTRCIGVDIRYVLFLIDRWGKAERLIEEIL